MIKFNIKSILIIGFFSTTLDTLLNINGARLMKTSILNHMPRDHNSLFERVLVGTMVTSKYDRKNKANRVIYLITFLLEMFDVFSFKNTEF